MNIQMDLSTILDQCLDDMARGRSLSSCLERFPQHADELRPLLEAAIRIRRLPRPVASPAAVEQGKARMLAALKGGAVAARRGHRQAARKGPRWQWRLALRGAVAAATVVAVLALALLVRTPVGWFPAQVVPAAAMVAEVQGEVEVCDQVCELWEPAVEGRALLVGDTVRTLETGSALLTYSDGSATEMLPDTEILLVELPGESQGPVLYQARGEARHRLGEGDASAGDARDGDFEVRSPAFTTVVSDGAFVLRVDEDGATGLSVSSGHAVAYVGATVRELAAGGVLFATVATEDAPPILFDGTDATPVPSTPTAVEDEDGIGAPEGPGRPETPPGQEVRPEVPPGQDVRPEVPPGQDGKPETPPGQDVKPEVPPGQEVKPEVPPGQEERPETPPGQENKPEVPPGQDQKPETPPGQEDREPPPPGQEERPETPPGQENRPEVPPGQEERPDTPPGQEKRPETPPGQQIRP